MPRSSIQQIVPAALLAIHAVLLGWQAACDSPTWDEIPHFAAGLEHWQHGRFDLFCVNPPLVRLVATGPIAPFVNDLDPSQFDVNRGIGVRAEFELGRKVAKKAGQSYFRLILASRMICIPFSLIGAWVCYRWAKDLWGFGAGTVSLSIWCFSPTVLAYGHLIAPDLASAAMGVSASYLFRRWLLHPKWKRAGLAGLVLGFAELTKSTWLILVPLWPVLWFVFRMTTARHSSRKEWMSQCAHLCLAFFAALWLLNLGYGFEGSFKPLGEFEFISETLSGSSSGSGNRFHNSILAQLPLPLPASYVAGIDCIKHELESKRWWYLRGQFQRGGWYYYYFYALLVKETVGTWLLLLIACVLTVIGGGLYRAPISEELLLVVPAGVLFVFISLQTGINDHVRYILPVIPFVFTWIGKVGLAYSRHRFWVSLSVSIALAMLILSSLVQCPASLSYFNEVARGPRNGYRHLGGSNIDWGQDLFRMKNWYDQHPNARPLYVQYELPLIDLAAAGIESATVPVGPTSDNTRTISSDLLGPQPGWYCVAAKRIYCDGSHKLDYFKRFEPIEWIGSTMMVYHISLDEANAVRRSYGLPELQAD